MALCLSTAGVASPAPGARQARVCEQAGASAGPREHESTKHWLADCTRSAASPSSLSPSPRPSTVGSCTKPR
jgi:hypothetical protein